MPWEQARPRERTDVPDAWDADTFGSPYVEIPPAIEAYAREIVPSGRPIGEAATDLMHRVYADFTYKSGSTTLSTKVGQLLRQRSGVCQDYAHFAWSRGAVSVSAGAMSAAISPPARRPADRDR